MVGVVCDDVRIVCSMFKLTMGMCELVKGVPRQRPCA